jgi:hypothetical protein
MDDNDHPFIIFHGKNYVEEEEDDEYDDQLYGNINIKIKASSEGAKEEE